MEGSIAAKFIYDSKKNRNAVVQVNAETRLTLFNKNFKIGWQVCWIDDYITVTRRYKCSNDTDLRGELICALCAGNHTLKECKADGSIFKCINCENYKKHNPTITISVAQPALDRNCPRLKEILHKRLNTEY
jgi:hypothetical protein